MDGGFGREDSFTGLSGGQNNGEERRIGCLVPNWAERFSPAQRKDNNNGGCISRGDGFIGTIGIGKKSG